MNWLLVALVVANLLTFLWLSQHQELRHVTEWDDAKGSLQTHSHPGTPIYHVQLRCSSLK
jgi:hypothetical protein